MQPPDLDTSRLSDHEIANRDSWNADSEAYQTKHAAQLEESGGAAWGCWQIPESRLNVLGDVAGKDILEFGCGAAQWSIKLAMLGARPVGMDLSERQLEHGRRLMAESGVAFPLVHASAERVPLPDGSFDIVFCDWGAMTFADPYATVPEAARLLRPGGLLAFLGSTPIVEMCYPEDDDHAGTQLLIDYFGMRALPYEAYVEFMLPYGEWIRLFRANGFAIEDLIEIRPDEDATSSYRDDLERTWCRRWPAEQIWKVRKEG